MSCPIDKDSLAQLKVFIDLCIAKPEILSLPELGFFKGYIETLGGKIPAPKMQEKDETVEMAEEIPREPEPAETAEEIPREPKPAETAEEIPREPKPAETAEEIPREPEPAETAEEIPREPEPAKTAEEIPKEPKPTPVKEEVESEPESELEFDTEGCLEPDEINEELQVMGDPSKKVSEEEVDQADEKRVQAMEQLGEGNSEKAVELFCEAIKINPQSALLFAKRGQAYLKLSKPNACIKDCTQALELNCDSAAAYKFRGRAYRLLGEWEKAAQDLRQAVKIDYDEQTDEWLKDVQPNAHKIEQHRLKQERKRLEKEELDRIQRIKMAREAHRAAPAPDLPTGMSDIYKLLQDPEILTAFQDPEVSAAFQDITINPANLSKYQSNPKIKNILEKLATKVKAEGMSFPTFPGASGFTGFPAGTSDKPPKTSTDDDALD